MLPKLNAILVWFWAPFLLAAVLGFRLAVGAAGVLIILSLHGVGRLPSLLLARGRPRALISGACRFTAADR